MDTPLPYGLIGEVLRRAGRGEGKKVGKDEYSYQCVFHDDTGRPNLEVNYAKNVYKCWSCDAHGGLVELAKHLGVDVSDHLNAGRPRGRPKRTYDWQACAEALPNDAEALKLLADRGFTVEALKAHFIGVTRRLEPNERGGEFRIVIPILDENGNLLFWRRYHPDNELAIPEAVSLAEEPLKRTEVKDGSASCPACRAPIPVERRSVGWKLPCGACKAMVRVHGRRTKIWASGDADREVKSAIWSLQMLVSMRRAADEHPQADKLVIITEGEWDRVILEQHGFHAVTGTAGATTWKDEWSKLFDNLDVVILYDKDEAGSRGARKVRDSLQDRSMVSSLRLVEWPFAPGEVLANGSPAKDACDWFALGHTAEALREAIENAERAQLRRRPDLRVIQGGGAGAGGGGAGGAAPPGAAGAGAGEPPPGDARARIDEVRWERRAPAHNKRQRIAAIVLADLDARGRFLKTRARELYYFLDGQRRLYRIGNQESDVMLDAFISDEYLINKSEEDYRYIMNHLVAHALNRGHFVEVRYHSHYDPDRGRVYISRLDGTVARVSVTGYDIVANGTDGVMFLDKPEKYTPWDFVGEFDLEGAVAELMRYMSDINFDNARLETARVPGTVQPRQFLLWVISLFFASVIAAKPLCVFIGPAGAGKSYAFRRVLQLFYGPDVDVSRISRDDPDAFEAAVVNSHLVVFDNVDSPSTFMSEALATIATGGELVKRKLYTTMEQVTFRPVCYVGITSRNPHFSAPDVVDRMLPFRVERRPADTFATEFSLRPKQSDRGRFYSAAVTIIRHVLGALAEGKRPEKTRSRMADWTTMAVCIAAALGWSDVDADEVIGLIEDQRTEFMKEETDLPGLISRFLENEARLGVAISTADLAQEINKILEADKERYHYNQRSLGRKMREVLPAIRRDWDVVVTTGNKKSVMYTFGKHTNGVRPPVPQQPELNIGPPADGAPKNEGEF